MKEYTLEYCQHIMKINNGDLDLSGTQIQDAYAARKKVKEVINE